MTFVTTEQAAYLLGMPVRTLNHHVKSDGAPRHGYNQYDPAELIQWYASHMRKLLQEARAGNSEREARRRIANARAELVERDLMRSRQELIPFALVVQGWTENTARLKTRLLTIPSKLAARLMGCTSAREIQTALDQEIRDALNELAETETGTRQEREVEGRDPR